MILGKKSKSKTIETGALQERILLTKRISSGSEVYIRSPDQDAESGILYNRITSKI